MATIGDPKGEGREDSQQQMIIAIPMMRIARVEAFIIQQCEKICLCSQQIKICMQVRFDAESVPGRKADRNKRVGRRDKGGGAVA